MNKYFNVLDIDRATLEAGQVASDIGEGTLEASTDMWGLAGDLRRRFTGRDLHRWKSESARRPDKTPAAVEMECIRKPGRWLRKRGPQGAWELLGWLGEVALRGCFSTSLYLWLCSSWQRCESAPLDGKQPLTWMVAGCFTALHLFLSAQPCFWMFLRKGQSVLHVFVATSLPWSILQKPLLHCACRCTPPCLLHSWPRSALAVPRCWITFSRHESLLHNNWTSTSSSILSCKATMTAHASLQVTMINKGRTMISNTTLRLKHPVCYSEAWLHFTVDTNTDSQAVCLQLKSATWGGRPNGLHRQTSGVRKTGRHLQGPSH